MSVCVCPAGLSWCALDDGDVPREEVRRLKVELEASKTRHMQELKAKNDYVRKSHQLRREEVEYRGEGWGGELLNSVLLFVLRLNTWREYLQSSER